MPQLTQYQELINKLDAFIRKYYVNQLIRGSLLTIGLLVLVFLIFSLGENYFYFGKSFRKVLFWSFLGLAGYTLYMWVLLPAIHYFKLGQIISHEQAALIIGRHFSDVEDKLLNILQLHRQWQAQSESALLLAGIEQKTAAIRLTPFTAAIDLNQNKRYLRYALPPLLITGALFLLAPSLIRDPASRIIANNREFEKPAPFQFVLKNDKLKVVQNGDFELEVNTEGVIVPNDAFIAIGDYEYRMRKTDENTFVYTFSNVSKPVDFKLHAGDVVSLPFRLQVMLKPVIDHIEMELTYPTYTGRAKERLSNTADLVVPVGTHIAWSFKARHTEGIQMRFGDQSLMENIKRQGDDFFVFSKRATVDERYTIFPFNAELQQMDSMQYHLSVIPDLHPTIQVQMFSDSLDPSFFYFAGDATDDYGLTQLSFQYQIKRYNGTEEPPVIKPVTIAKIKNQHFDYAFDVREVQLSPGDEVTWFFEVWDNDAINGRKSSRTHIMRYAKPTAEAYDAIEKQNNEQIKDKLQKAMEESKKIQKDIQKLTEKMLQEKQLNWQQRKELEKLNNRQKDLMKEIQDAKEKFQENLRNQQEFSNPSEELLKKQEKLEKMFEEMLSEEMKEMIRQLEEMLQEMKKEDALQKMEEMKMDKEQLSKELDRMMELYKELELEKDIQEQIEKLEEIAKAQEKLSEQTENNQSSQEELKKKQDELNEAFDTMQKEMKEILERNKELEQPKQLGDPEEKMEEINKDMDNASDELNQNQNKKASKSQKGAAKKMKDMAKAMQMNMDSQEMEEMEEDMKALRQLLENLVTLSFDQENLISEVGKTAEIAPRYVQLVQVQKKLQEDFRLVEDSLHALSKRNMQIESFINDKVSEIKINMNRTLTDLEERKKQQASVEQQFAMKNLNDLALMLSEVMNQTQQQMSSMMAGNQNCKKPGGSKSGSGKPSDKMSQGQKSLNQIMKDLQARMKSGQGGSSREFAEMAAKQAAMRKALESLSKEKSRSGKPDRELQDIIDQMDKTEIDLVNKRLTNETLRRQEDILKKLLDHEKAERERDMDEQRKSESASQYERKMPPALEEYLRQRKAELDLYRTVNPSLRPYYKNMVEEYQQNMKNSR